MFCNLFINLFGTGRFWHIWSKWELYEEQHKKFNLFTEKYEPIIKIRQRRHCEDCGYQQDRLVR